MMRVKVRVYNEEYVGHVTSYESEHELEDLYVFEHPRDGHLSLCDRSEGTFGVVAWKASPDGFGSPRWNHNDAEVERYVFERIVVEPVEVCYGVEFDGYGGYAVVHGRPPELNDPETNAAIQRVCRAAYDSLEER